MHAVSSPERPHLISSSNIRISFQEHSNHGLTSALTSMVQRSPSSPMDTSCDRHISSFDIGTGSEQRRHRFETALRTSNVKSIPSPLTTSKLIDRPSGCEGGTHQVIVFDICPSCQQQRDHIRVVPFTSTMESSRCLRRHSSHVSMWRRGLTHGKVAPASNSKDTSSAQPLWQACSRAADPT
jgi:hypothetical protein